MNVQHQKHGSGGQAFDFLNEPSKKPAAMQADEDMGFDEMQMRILEDTEQVRYCIFAVRRIVRFQYWLCSNIVLEIEIAGCDCTLLRMLSRLWLCNVYELNPSYIRRT